MTVSTPNITTQETEADRQKRISDANATKQRQDDLNRLISQFGSNEDLQKAVEALQKTYDDSATANASAANSAASGTRDNALSNQEINDTISQQTSDLGAVLARASADQKNKRLTDAQSGVDSAYSGYDDGYYNRYAQSIIDSQLPSLRDQYQEKNRSTSLALGTKGIGQSSAAARIIARLAGQQANDEATLAANASGSATSLADRISGQRSQALQVALAGAQAQNDVPVAGADLQTILGAIKGVSTARNPSAGIVPAAGSAGAIPTTGVPTAGATYPTAPAALPTLPQQGGGAPPTTADDSLAYYGFTPQQAADMGINFYQDGSYSTANGAPIPQQQTMPMPINQITFPKVTLPVQQGTAPPTTAADPKSAGVKTPLQPIPTDPGHTAAPGPDSGYYGNDNVATNTDLADIGTQRDSAAAGARRLQPTPNPVDTNAQQQKAQTALTSQAPPDSFIADTLRARAQAI